MTNKQNDNALLTELHEDIVGAELLLEEYQADLLKATTDEERELIERRIENAQEEVNFLWSIELSIKDGEEDEF